MCLFPLFTYVQVMAFTSFLNESVQSLKEMNETKLVGDARFVVECCKGA
jgi:hypothetical protein